MIHKSGCRRFESCRGHSMSRFLRRCLLSWGQASLRADVAARCRLTTTTVCYFQEESLDLANPAGNLIRGWCQDDLRKLGNCVGEAAAMLNLVTHDSLPSNSG